MTLAVQTADPFAHALKSLLQKEHEGSKGETMEILPVAVGVWNTSNAVTSLYFYGELWKTGACREKGSKVRGNNVEGFDSVVTVGEKLSHPTASRPKSSGRRPPSQSLTSSSLSSPDFFDSPSPEEEKDELAALAQRAIEASKKTSRSATTSQMPDHRTVLPPKPGGLIASVSFSHGASGAPSAFHTVAAGSHRSNSPSFSSAETRQKADHSQSPLEELQSQVKELKSIIETMKDQQKKEIKQLLSELDEEKKIRLRLQMDVNEIKKSLQSK